jgi:hypothetical protein
MAPSAPSFDAICRTRHTFLDRIGRTQCQSPKIFRQLTDTKRANHFPSCIRHHVHDFRDHAPGGSSAFYIGNILNNSIFGKGASSFLPVKELPIRAHGHVTVA